MPRTQSAAGRIGPHATLARRSEPILDSRSTRRFRLPSLTGLLVRGLVLLFGLTVVWKLALLGLETYELSRWTRPPVVAQPGQLTAPPATDAGLDAILREAGLPGGVVGAYVRNLATGAGAGLNAERRFPAASLFKLPLLVEVYKQQRLKRFSWDDQLTVGRDQWTDGSGVLQARVGDSLRIGDLVRLTIDESDNIAANMLADLVGVANVNETMEALGLRNTHLVDRARENSAPTTSPEDMGRLLEIIATGRLVDAQTSEEVLRLLERKQAQSWLAGGLPWWGKLAHKWGDLPNARHDAGIIYTPRNQIVLVVLTENGPPAAAADQIRSLSRSVVGYIEGPGP
ncbi:MAG TPA: serine hydrolase [Chloroflexota bacterium]|nr:serine hydrolase [Chloroflexota bacterium]